MKTLLLSGYSNQSETHPALKKIDEQFWIDDQIKNLLKLNHQVVTVIGDKFSEEILSQSKLLQKTELVFDFNLEKTSILTNLKSGLKSVNHSCYFLPVHVPVPEKKVWTQLENHFYRNSDLKVHLIKSFTPKKGQMAPIFPQIVTPSGKNLFSYSSSINSLDDQSISYSPVPIISKLYLKGL